MTLRLSALEKHHLERDPERWVEWWSYVLRLREGLSEETILSRYLARKDWEGQERQRRVAEQPKAD